MPYKLEPPNGKIATGLYSTPGDDYEDALNALNIPYGGHRGWFVPDANSTNLSGHAGWNFMRNYTINGRAPHLTPTWQYAKNDNHSDTVARKSNLQGAAAGMNDQRILDDFAILRSQNNGRRIWLRGPWEFTGSWSGATYEQFQYYKPDRVTKRPVNNRHHHINFHRRFVEIARGGTVDEINQRLADLPSTVEGVPVSGVGNLPPLTAGGAGGTVIPKTEMAIGWGPNRNPNPNNPDNHEDLFYPGREWVDFLAVDIHHGKQCFSVSSILSGGVQRMYDKYCKPGTAEHYWWVFEFGPNGCDSGQWVRDIVAWYKAHPQVKGINIYTHAAGDGTSHPSHNPQWYAALRDAIHADPARFVYDPAVISTWPIGTGAVDGGGTSGGGGGGSGPGNETPTVTLTTPTDGQVIESGSFSINGTLDFPSNYTSVDFYIESELIAPGAAGRIHLDTDNSANVNGTAAITVDGSGVTFTRRGSLTPETHPAGEYRAVMIGRHTSGASPIDVHTVTLGTVEPEPEPPTDIAFAPTMTAILEPVVVDTTTGGIDPSFVKVLRRRVPASYRIESYLGDERNLAEVVETAPGVYAYKDQI